MGPRQTGLWGIDCNRGKEESRVDTVTTVIILRLTGEYDVRGMSKAEEMEAITTETFLQAQME